MEKEKEIAQLKKDIEYEEFQYQNGLDYPTYTDQFRRGMEKCRQRLSDMKSRLKELETKEKVIREELVERTIKALDQGWIPKKTKSIPTYESQHFSGLVVIHPTTGKNTIRINDERMYNYFLNIKCKLGDNLSVYYTNKKPKRSEAQNSYLHLYLSLISLSSGHTLKELKTWAKGKFLSKGITEVFGDKVRVVDSTTDLNRSEFQEFIERIEKTTEIPAPPTDLFKMPHSPSEHEKLKKEQTTLYSSLTVSKKLKIKTT